MTPREQRGREIAERFRITREGDVWRVPSQTGNGRYIVRIGENACCSCPDHQTTGFKCKHQWAVEFSLTMTQTTENADGSTTVRSVNVTMKKTYQQPSWPLYNAGQTNERRHFLALLGDLCDTIPAPAPKHNSKGGRPAIPLRDAIYSAVLKVYSLTSARRFNGQLEEAHAARYISQCPHFNSVLNVFDREETTSILRGMVEASALPLRSVETSFAVDSTGFSTIKYASWFDAKYNSVRRCARWVKAHFVTGVRTNVVPAVEIHDQHANDSPQLPSLTETTAKGFTVKEMSADKAYLAASNFAAVKQHGGMFFPQFKVNTVAAAGGPFAKAFHWFCFNRDSYLTHYHQRSNVESTVSMVKRKFGDSVKAKNELAQKNEVYAKFVCHNVCVLIAEMYGLGVQAIFDRPVGCTKTPELAQILRFPVR
jgi:transposase